MTAVQGSQKGGGERQPASEGAPSVLLHRERKKGAEKGREGGQAAERKTKKNHAGKKSQEDSLLLLAVSLCVCVCPH